METILQAKCFDKRMCKRRSDLPSIPSRRSRRKHRERKTDYCEGSQLRNNRRSVGNCANSQTSSFRYFRSDLIIEVLSCHYLDIRRCEDERWRNLHKSFHHQNDAHLQKWENRSSFREASEKVLFHITLSLKIEIYRITATGSFLPAFIPSFFFSSSSSLP